MDLVYLYVGEIGRPISHFGVNFSRRFIVNYDYATGKLYISKSNGVISPINIYGDNIKDVELIVGKNGCGKSTILSLLGLSRIERLREYPVYLKDKDDEKNKCTWFALYYIEDDYFAIEGNWCDTLEFMRGDAFLHFQTLYSLYFKYDYDKQTGYNVNHLQDLKLKKRDNFQKTLFFLYYENSASLDWVTSVGRIKRYDLGSYSMCERIMCEREGYRGIVRYLYAASHEKDFLKLMGTKPGTAIKISIYDRWLFSEFDSLSTVPASDMLDRDMMGRLVIDGKKAAGYVYGSNMQLIETSSLNFLNILQKKEDINMGLSFKESYIIAYLEQIAVYCIIHQGEDGYNKTKFNIEERNENQGLYEWRKRHLLHITRELLGEKNLDYQFINGIVFGLEEIPERFFVSYSEIEVVPAEMTTNFLENLMMMLDENQRSFENHEINHRYYLRTEFRGISNGEARMIDIFAMLYNSLLSSGHTKKDTCVLLLDEPDMGFHPEWSRIFIENLTKFLKSDIMSDYEYHIIISTHSPIMLSDVPGNCIHCISKDEDDRVTVKESDKFGLISGINDILIDDFFMGSIFGSFGEKYVNGIIKDINDLENDLIAEKNVGPLSRFSTN